MDKHYAEFLLAQEILNFLEPKYTDSQFQNLKKIIRLETPTK